MRVCVSLRLDVSVAQHFDAWDREALEEEARRVATRFVKRWLDQGLPPLEPGVSVEVKHARMGRVARE